MKNESRGIRGKVWNPLTRNSFNSPVAKLRVKRYWYKHLSLSKEMCER